MTQAHTDSEAVIDLRSDTVTRPSAPMREAMANAVVGDDVYHDDPTVKELERKAAEMLGKTAALYLPSGTQSNLSAVMAHCQRGDEYIIGDKYHVFRHEAGGTSVLGSTYPFPIPTQPDGSVSATDVRAAIKADDPHYPGSRLLCLENTVSGQAITPGVLAEPANAAREHGMKIHLDGARFFNAITATGVSANEMASLADSVSVCLSKGLGAPVGSVLVGDSQTIAKAHRFRKMLGGGMRQVGILAAAGLYALEHNVSRLDQDHQRASTLANALNELPGLWQAPVTAHTNMLFITPKPTLSDSMFNALNEQQIIVGAPLAVKRLVMHLDITDNKLDRIITAFKQINEKTA
jgi:threonine aldolase